MFESFGATWHGWGRSIALPGVETGWRPWFDLVVVALAQALPLPRLVSPRRDLIDAAALALRLGTLVGTTRAYTRRGTAYWCSPLADPVAVVRLGWSLGRPSSTWRGRTYPSAR
jgi:dolichol-phosphate mannosyltransferase